MAAIAPPIVPAGAPAPTVVTVTGTIPGNNLAITFLATDPFVINYPTLTFVFLAVVAGGAPQTASVPIGLAIRTWGGPLTPNDPAARNPRFRAEPGATFSNFVRVFFAIIRQNRKAAE